MSNRAEAVSNSDTPAEAAWERTRAVDRRPAADALVSHCAQDCVVSPGGVERALDAVRGHLFVRPLSAGVRGAVMVLTAESGHCI